MADWPVQPAATDNVKFYLNFQSGNAEDSAKTRLRQFDAVITAKVSDQFSLGYNGTVQKRTAAMAGVNMKMETAGGALHFT
jgi:hypothetical protein